MKKNAIVTAGIVLFLTGTLGTLSAEPMIENTMFSDEDVAYLRKGIQSSADEKEVAPQPEVAQTAEKNIPLRNTMFSKDDAEYFARVRNGEISYTPPKPQKPVAQTKLRNTMFDSQDQEYIDSVRTGKIEAKGPFTRLFEATGFISPE